MKKMTVLSCLLVSSLFLQACQKAEEPTLQPRPALVAEVKYASGNMDLVLVGEVKSRYASRQSFRIAGKIVERKVEVGDVVKKGQVLVRIDPSDSRLATQAARADVASAQANYDLAKAEVERQRQLVKQAFISQSALDLQEAQLKTSYARLKQAKAQAAVSNNQSRYTALIADRNGVVTQIQAEPGQVVEPGQMIATVVDQEQMEVLVALPESRIKGVKVGDAVTIALWADQETLYQGRVREVTPAASTSTRAFDLRVTIDSADENIKLGMTAGVKFASEQTDKIIIPSTAVTQRGDQQVVWVVDADGIANPRAVEIGAFTEYGIEVKSGLALDELIAIAGVHTLVEGQKVKPIKQKMSNQRG